jgi:hypothetical protein
MEGRSIRPNAKLVDAIRAIEVVPISFLLSMNAVELAFPSMVRLGQITFRTERSVAVDRGALTMEQRVARANLRAEHFSRNVKGGLWRAKVAAGLWASHRTGRTGRIYVFPAADDGLVLARIYSALPAHPPGTLRAFCRDHRVSIATMRLALERLRDLNRDANDTTRS